MARLSLATRNRKRRRRLILIWWNQLVTTLSVIVLAFYMLIVKYIIEKPRIRYSLSKIDRIAILNRYVFESDNMSISQIRMNRACFMKLCGMLQEFGGLKPNRNMGIEEQVAIFLHILAHNVKNRVIVCRFHRSGETISRCVSRVCNAVIRLHSRLLKKPEPIPENSTDPRWKWFKNCLGALDGTYIKCLVPNEEKAKYRTRKGEIATNVLGVCSPDMQFVFVLPGWEGSAADGRVLRDALDRPHGLDVPRPEMASKNRDYRGWSDLEDEKLIEALMNMVNTGGFKSDNGFRSGYLVHLEAALKESLPGSGLLGKLHIESRIRTMKKDWQAVYDLINTSGFGYDKETNNVTTSAPGVWEAYIETHKNAKKWKNKKLPHYEELCIIFGKDRAQGNRAKSVVEMEQEVNMEEQLQDDDFEASHNDDTNSSFNVNETSSARSKKRKRVRQADSLVRSFNDAIVLFGDRLKETSVEMSEDVKLEVEMKKMEVEMKKKTVEIPSELAKMTSLTQLERFRAIEKMNHDSTRVMTFWSLGEEEREAWVRFVLNEKA